MMHISFYVTIPLVDIDVRDALTYKDNVACRRTCIAVMLETKHWRHPNLHQHW